MEVFVFHNKCAQVKYINGLDMHKVALLFLKVFLFFPCPALSEVLSVKEVSGRKLYYVHYIDCKYYSHLLIFSYGIFNIVLKQLKSTVN